MSAIAELVERVRDTRQRMRLGVPVVEDLDELLDTIIEQLEEAEDAVAFLAFAEAGGDELEAGAPS